MLAAGLIGLSTNPPFPVPSVLLAEIGTGIANISCQFIFISQCLAAASKNTPAPLFAPPRTVNGETQLCPFHPATAINGAGKCATAQAWPAALEKSPRHTMEPSQLCHWGLSQKSRNTTKFLRRKVSHLSRWRHKQSHQPLTVHVVGNHRKDLLSLKPPNWAYNCTWLMSLWMRKLVITNGFRSGRTVRWYILYFFVVYICSTL